MFTAEDAVRNRLFFNEAAKPPLRTVCDNCVLRPVYLGRVSRIAKVYLGLKITEEQAAWLISERCASEFKNCWDPMLISNPIVARDIAEVIEGKIGLELKFRREE